MEKTRRKCGTIWEIITPLLFMLLLIIPRQIRPPTNQGATYFEESPIDITQPPITPPLDNEIPEGFGEDIVEENRFPIKRLATIGGIISALFVIIIVI